MLARSTSTNASSAPVPEHNGSDCVTIVPAHDGPLQLEFFGNGKLKSKKGNEMCWYRQTLSQSAQPIPVRHPGLAAWR